MIPKDEENICLKCEHAIGIDYNHKIQLKDYSYTPCDCWLWHRNSKNAGHRRTCKEFIAKENADK